MARAICFKCGGNKPSAFVVCPRCGTHPTSDDDLVSSMILSEHVLPASELDRAATIISGGQQINFPPELRTSIFSAINAARSSVPQAPKPSGWKWKAGLAAVIAFVIFLSQPWPHYQWAAWQDTVPAYERFLRDYPSNDYADLAKERVRIMQEDSVWQTAQVSDDIDKLRDYLKIYPDGKYTAEAKARSVDLADQQWKPVADSRSEAAIRRFLKRFPETTLKEEAEKRIHQLYDDLAWVREQDTLEAYKRFLDRNPQTRHRVAIEKKIIDFEVAAIAAGDHGELPKAQAISSNANSSSAEVVVENETSHELTVRYSGSDSQKLIIPAGETRSLRMQVGSYTVAASVSAANVRNFVGTETMQGGRYESRFYIETSVSPTFGTGFRKRR